MQSITDLSHELTTLFSEIRSDEIDLKKAGELNNTAGKILKVYQVQLAYHALRNEAPLIPFLGSGVEVKAKLVPKPPALAA